MDKETWEQIVWDLWSTRTRCHGDEKAAQVKYRRESKNGVG